MTRAHAGTFLPRSAAWSPKKRTTSVVPSAIAGRFVVKSTAAPNAIASSPLTVAMPAAAIGGASATAIVTPTSVPVRPGRASAEAAATPERSAIPSPPGGPAVANGQPAGTSSSSQRTRRSAMRSRTSR